MRAGTAAVQVLTKRDQRAITDRPVRHTAPRSDPRRRRRRSLRRRRPRAQGPPDACTHASSGRPARPPPGLLETSSVIERLVSGAALTANADKMRPDIAVKRHMHVLAQLDDVARLLADDASLASRYAGHHLAKSVVYPLQRRSVSSAALVGGIEIVGASFMSVFSDCRCISPLPVAAAATVHATTAGDFSVPPTLVRLSSSQSACVHGSRQRWLCDICLQPLLVVSAREGQWASKASSSSGSSRRLPVTCNRTCTHVRALHGAHYVQRRISAHRLHAGKSNIAHNVRNACRAQHGRCLAHEASP